MPEIDLRHSDAAGQVAINEAFFHGRKAEVIPRPDQEDWVVTQNQKDFAFAACYWWWPALWRQALAEHLAAQDAEHMRGEQGGGFPYIRYTGPAMIVMAEAARMHGDEAILEMALRWWERSLGLWELGDPGTGRSYIPGCRMGGGVEDPERDKVRATLKSPQAPGVAPDVPAPLDMSAFHAYALEARRRGMPQIKPSINGLNLRHLMHWERYDAGVRLWIPNLGEGKGVPFACYGFPAWAACADSHGRVKSVTGIDYLVQHGEVASYAEGKARYRDLAKEWTGRRSLLTPPVPDPWPAMGSLREFGAIGPGQSPGRVRLPPLDGGDPPPPEPPVEPRPLDVDAVVAAAREAAPHVILEAKGWQRIKDGPLGAALVEDIIARSLDSALKGNMRGIEALAEAIGYGGYGREEGT